MQKRYSSIKSRQTRHCPADSSGTEEDILEDILCICSPSDLYQDLHDAAHWRGEASATSGEIENRSGRQVPYLSA